MLYRSDIASFFIDFFVLNELTQTPLQKIPSNPQKDTEQSAKRYRAIRKKIPSDSQKDTDKQNKNRQTRRKLGGFRFLTAYLRYCSPLNFATNKQFFFFLRSGKTNQHLFGKGFQVVRRCALCPLQHSVQQRCCTLYR